MDTAGQYEIVDDSASPADDRELVALLRRVYVDGGFTDLEVAKAVFTPEAIRARGRILYARDSGRALAGMLVVVAHDSPARRLAAAHEAEMHLFAVDERHRRKGVGRALVLAAVEVAQRDGCRAVVLWTQPTMLAAHQLYEQAGFWRSPAEDFVRDGREFLVYRRRF